MEKKRHIIQGYFSPARLFLIIAVSVFLIEAMIMIILPHSPVLSATTAALLDTSALVLLLSPILYFFLFRPLLGHINERMASEERLSVITDNAADAIICVDDRDKIYIWNKKAYEIFGYTAEEAKGRPVHSLIVPERYREKAGKAYEVFLKTGTGPIIGKIVELSALRKDGSEFPVELSVSAMNVRGHWHSTAIIRDITERKKMEDECRQRIEELQRLNKLMVGRELRMEELKKEIYSLEDRIIKLRGPDER